MIQQYVLRVVLAGTLAAALLPGRLATAADAEHAWRGYCGPVSGFGEKGQVGTEGNKQPSVAQFRLSTFSADVTCPVGHPLLGGLYAAAEKIVDPLQAQGFVLLGPDEPIVLCAIDWCEIRNQSYDLWRDKLAEAAGTRRERVLVCSLHQHDAPLTDRCPF